LIDFLANVIGTKIGELEWPWTA